MLKTLVTFALLGLSPLVFSKWEFHRQYDKTSIFKAPKGSRLTVEFMPTAEDKDKTKDFNLNFLKGLEEKKAKILSMIGVKEWQVTDRKINRIKEDKKNEGNGPITELIFSGSYIDRKGQKIFFHENHRYSANSRLQILVTNKKEKNLKSDLKKNPFTEVINNYVSRK